MYPCRSNIASTLDWKQTEAEPATAQLAGRKDSPSLPILSCYMATSSPHITSQCIDGVSLLLTMLLPQTSALAIPVVTAFASGTDQLVQAEWRFTKCSVSLSRSINFPDTRNARSEDDNCYHAKDSVTKHIDALKPSSKGDIYFPPPNSNTTKRSIDYSRPIIGYGLTRRIRELPYGRFTKYLLDCLLSTH